MDRLIKIIRSMLPKLINYAILLLFIVVTTTFSVSWRIVFTFLKDNKDALIAFSNILTAIGFFAAFFVSYVKFFAGKLFAHRVQVSISVSLGTISNSENLHLVRVIVHNPGNLVFYIKEVILSYTNYTSELVSEKISIRDFPCVADNINEFRELRVDPGLSSIFNLTLRHNNRFRITVYEAVIIDKIDGLWMDSALVQN